MANNTAAQQRSGLTSRPISHQERFVTQPQLRHAILGYRSIGTNLLLSLWPEGRDRVGTIAENRNTEMACGRRANRQKQRMQTALIEPRLDIGSADGAYRHSSPVFN